MNPFEFTRKHLGQFKEHGSELIPRYCPFCQGGKSKDKDTFALNTEKLTYNCKRGSCGKSGTFYQLCKEFGEEADRDNYEIRQPRREYKKPQTVIKPATDPIEKYMAIRKISKSTYEKWGVGSDGRGNIVFPYYDERNELAFIKFRPARKIEKGERKMWRESDCRPILWGMNQCDFNKPLIITEGEFDALSLTESGIDNAVSVPSGAEDMTWLDECWEWLERFDRIIIFGDNDNPGQEMVRKLILKLGEHRCYTVENKYKDANELLYREGPEAGKKAVENAKPVPVYGLIDLADVTPLDMSRVERVPSNIKFLDNAIGGFYMGELSVWTGKRAQGKSTILGQILLEAVNEGKAVCAYSGELRADRFQYWVNLQAAGPMKIKTYMDPVKEKDISYLDKDVTEQIKDWYRGKFFLYDNSLTIQNTEEAGILKIFTYAAKRYDCKVFLVDNLMTARFDTINDSNYYRAQSNFVGELVNFAKSFNVHVHLVAHPRKTREQLDNDDVSGTGDITNRADNVFSIDRVSEDSEIQCDTILKILKCRQDGGAMGEKIGLNFDPLSKRFYLPSIPGALHKKYSWDKVYKQSTIGELGTEVDIPREWLK